MSAETLYFLPNVYHHSLSAWSPTVPLKAVSIPLGDLILTPYEVWDFLMVQWLRLYAPNAGGQGLIPWAGNYITQVVAKDPACYSQINTQKY